MGKISSQLSQNNPSDNQDSVYLVVSVPEQKMQLRRRYRILATYSISTSKFGLGCQKDSQRTPLGHFHIYAKIGQGAALGEIFRGRQATGIIASQGGEEDLITTRILWLEGLDSENANTRERYIYIHGTNQENLLGQSASHGCVRMGNVDISELFERIHTNDRVFILNIPLEQFPPPNKDLTPV